MRSFDETGVRAEPSGFRMLWLALQVKPTKDLPRPIAARRKKNKASD
jgi:hypothetical protein